MTQLTLEQLTTLSDDFHKQREDEEKRINDHVFNSIVKELDNNLMEAVNNGERKYCVYNVVARPNGDIRLDFHENLLEIKGVAKLIYDYLNERGLAPKCIKEDDVFNGIFIEW